MGLNVLIKIINLPYMRKETEVFFGVNGLFLSVKVTFFFRFREK